MFSIDECWEKMGSNVKTLKSNGSRVYLLPMGREITCEKYLGGQREGSIHKCLLHKHEKLSLIPITFV